MKIVCITLSDKGRFHCRLVLLCCLIKCYPVVEHHILTYLSCKVDSAKLVDKFYVYRTKRFFHYIYKGESHCTTYLCRHREQAKSSLQLRCNFSAVVSIMPGLFYPFYGRLGGPWGPVWTGMTNLTPTRIWSPYHPACSRSLYWLHYPCCPFFTKANHLYPILKHLNALLHSVSVRYPVIIT